MSKSKKPEKFSKVSAVKSNARDRVGMPKPSTVITPKNKRAPKYKEDLLTECPWRDDLFDEEWEELQREFEGQ